MTAAPRKPKKPSGCVEYLAYDVTDLADRELFIRRLAAARLFGVTVGSIGDIQVTAVEHYPYRWDTPEKGIDITADVSAESRALTVRVDRDFLDFARHNPGMVRYTLEENDDLNELYGRDIGAAYLALGAFAAKAQGAPYRHSIATQPDSPSPFSPAA